MSQINPFRGVVVPSATPQRVQPQKERQQRRPPQKPRKESTEPDEVKPADDGKPHVDLKA